MADLMNLTEINSAITFYSTFYPNLCTRITLPEASIEGRSIYALRVGRYYDIMKAGAVIIAGVHAREWGGPDIAINFVGDLLRAYTGNAGLAYGAKTFTAVQIKTLIEKTTILVIPCVNPDGVNHSLSGNAPMWRKNMSMASAGGDPAKRGVDINRNYDFLWDYKRHFHPTTWLDSLASDNPASNQYHGPAPFSEPETRNVRWLMDQHPFSQLFLDLHSYAGTVLHNWGDDQNQTTHPDQNFTNPAYDGQRGRANDNYGEYIESADLAKSQKVAAAVRDAMKAVRNRPYLSSPAFGLYPTSGASDDYAFSRHFADSEYTKIFGFTLEFNFSSDAAASQSPFHATADPVVLDNTMLDVIPGLIEFCLQVRTWSLPPFDLTYVPNVIYTNPATGEIWYIDSKGKIRRKPPPPPPYTEADSIQIWTVLNAIESLRGITGEIGDTARLTLYDAVGKLAAEGARKIKAKTRKR